MRTLVALIVSSFGVASLAALACNRSADRTGTGQANEGVVATSTAAVIRDVDADRRVVTLSADSSPYVVGTWKFVANPDGGIPSVDSEFRFINPTSLDLTLEYAFFELDGVTFCGCDRDDLPPNKTTVYTMFGESMTTPMIDAAAFPHVFTCTGTSGALKSIVFEHKGQKIFLDDALQVGLQTHAFGNIMELPPDASPSFNFLTGAVMTESDLSGIAINDATRTEIQAIHQHCVDVNGPLQ
jgi:hypothetical protein